MWNLVLDLGNFSLFARYELFRFGFLNLVLNYFFSNNSRMVVLFL